MCYTKGEDVELVVSYLDEDTNKVVRESKHYNGMVWMIQLMVGGNEVTTLLTEDAVVRNGLDLADPEYEHATI